MSMEKRPEELRVRGIALDDRKGDPIVLLEERRRGLRLGLPVGPFEASAILLELEGITPPRPFAHDLLADLFREAGFILEGVVLSGSPARGGRARLAYRKGPSRREREVRPADAIALALRLGAPIAAEPGFVEAAALRRRPCGAETPRILALEDWKERAMGA